jgi:hypothetical protein
VRKPGFKPLLSIIQLVPLQRGAHGVLEDDLDVDLPALKNEINGGAGYKLNPVVTHGLKAPGFNPWTCQNENPVSNLCFQMQVVPLHHGVQKELVGAGKKLGKKKKGSALAECGIDLTAGLYKR